MTRSAGCFDDKHDGLGRACTLGTHTKSSQPLLRSAHILVDLVLQMHPSAGMQRLKSNMIYTGHRAEAHLHSSQVASCTLPGAAAAPRTHWPDSV